MSRLFAATLALLMLLGASGLAFRGMDHGAGHGNQKCVAAVTQGSECPLKGDLAGYLNFHVGALKGLSTEALPWLILFIGILPMVIFTFSTPESVHLRSGNSLSPYARSRKKFLAWLALFEQRSPRVTS